MPLELKKMEYLGQAWVVYAIANVSYYRGIFDHLYL